MKRICNPFFLFISILFFISSVSTYADVNIGIEGISPNGIQQTQSYDIYVNLTNYSSPANFYFVIKWTVSDDYTNTKAELSNTYTSSAELAIDSFATEKIKVGSYTFSKDKKYLIIAEIVEVYTFVLLNKIDITNNSSFTKHYQMVNAPYSDIGAFTIDSPSPENSNTSDGLYATLKNYGNNKLYSAYVKYIRQTTDQKDIITPVDTFYSLWVPKYTKWTRKFFVFNPPIDSGDYIQIKIEDNNKTADVILVSSWQPNGLSDYAGDDTTRAFFGSNLLGKYSISNNKDYKASFNSINDAIEYLYDKGFYTDQASAAITGFGGGVQLYVREGTYEGSWNFNGLPSNSSLKNTLSISSFSDDSTQTIINPSGSTGYTVLLNNMQFLSVKSFTFNGDDNSNVIKMSGHSKNFVISNSILNAKAVSSTDPSFSVVYADNLLDSCTILNCYVVNGSYGIYFSGSSSKMHSVGVSHCYFNNQTNAAISYENHSYPFLLHNVINNNRAEILNSNSPIIVNNRIYVDEDLTSIDGKGYSSGETKSGLLLLNCSDTLIINSNNFCMKYNNAYALHLKNCINPDSDSSSVINNNSFQSNISAVYMQNVNNVFFSNVSANMTGSKTSGDAGVFMDNECTNIKMVKNVFNSSGSGYALYLASKQTLVSSIRDNLFSNGNAFAYVEGLGEVNNLETFKKYMGFFEHNLSSNLDPQFYDDCDLIACNPSVKEGYGKCNTVLVPNLYFPEHNSSEHLLDIDFSWQGADTSFSYWLQVSKSADFGGIIYKDDENFNAENDLVFDLQGIKNVTQTVYNLLPSTNYYWRLKICCDEHRSSWSKVLSFTTGTGAVGVESKDINSENIILYPNPANDIIYLNKPNADIMQNDLVSIYDIYGKLILKSKIDSNQNKPHINIDNLVQGIYILKFRNYNIKFIKY